MLRTVPDDNVETEPPYFRFWTKSEVTRIGCVMSLTLAPLSFAAIDAPHDASAASRAEVPAIADSPNPTGFLRSVRMTDFNAARLDLQTMGDVE